jgi:hypothetical protein
LGTSKAELTKLATKADDSKNEFDEAMDRFRDKKAQAEFGKDALREAKDGLKKVYDEAKKVLRAQQQKVDTSTKVCERDKIEKQEMEHEARRIKLYNGYGKPVRRRR